MGPVKEWTICGKISGILHLSHRYLYSLVNEGTRAHSMTAFISEDVRPKSLRNRLGLETAEKQDW